MDYAAESLKKHQEWKGKIEVVKLLIAMGLRDVILCDLAGAIYEGREGMNAQKAEMAVIFRIRSTMSWPFREFSGVPWMSAPVKSTMR